MYAFDAGVEKRLFYAWAHTSFVERVGMLYLLPRLVVSCQGVQMHEALLLVRMKYKPSLLVQDRNARGTIRWSIGRDQGDKWKKEEFEENEGDFG